MKRTLLLASLVLAAACGNGSSSKDCIECNSDSSPDSLDGSYCEDTPMCFTEVRAKVQAVGADKAITIEWIKPAEAGLEKTLSVLISTRGLQIEADTTVDFLANAGSVRRVLPEGQRILTQELNPATTRATFHEYTGEIGSPVSGQVNLLFKSGRTLNGKFATTLVDALSTVE